MATRVWESAVIDAPIEKTWALIRPLDFSYLSSVVSAEIDGKQSYDEVGVTKVLTYKDGTKQRIKLIGLSDATYSISWDIIESEPPVGYTGVSHSVRLRRVTDSNQTFITWTADFSRDASVEVTEDQRHKQRENFSALQAAVRGAKAKEGKEGKKEEKEKVMPGGKGHAQSVDAETAQFVNSQKRRIEEKAGASFQTFELVSVRKQVVAGINFFVKIRVGDDKYIHVTIWRKPSGEATVTDVHANKRKDDEL
jgi:cystatin-A/B